jgi:hypothetical protein
VNAILVAENARLRTVAHHSASRYSKRWAWSVSWRECNLKDCSRLRKCISKMRVSRVARALEFEIVRVISPSSVSDCRAAWYFCCKIRLAWQLFKRPAERDD